MVEISVYTVLLISCWNAKFSHVMCDVSCNILCLRLHVHINVGKLMILCNGLILSYSSRLSHTGWMLSECSDIQFPLNDGRLNKPLLGSNDAYNNIMFMHCLV